MADGSITFDVEILDKRAKERLSALDQLIKDTGDSMDESLSNQAQKFIADWNKASSMYQKTMNDIEMGARKIADLDVSLEFFKDSGDTQAIREIGTELNNAKLEQDKLVSDSMRYANQMDTIGIKAEQLTNSIRGSTAETTKQMTFTEKIKGSFEMIKNSVVGVDKGLKSATTSSKSLKSNTDGLGNSIRGGIKQMIKLSTVMLGMRGIMGGLRKVTNQWYNSMDMGARQAKANMESVTNGIVNLLAPALTFVTNMLATLMGYINAISKAFFGVDLLSKSTAKNMGAGAKNAKKTEKALKGWMGAFDEADVASSNIADNLDGAGGGGGGIPDLEPNIKTPDLSEFKSQLENLFKPFLDTMKTLDFEPMKEAFRGLAKVGKESAEIIGMSFVRTMNEAVAPFIKLMVEDIIPKGLNTVTRILQRLNPVIDRLLKKFVEPLIKWFLLDFAPVGFQTVFSILEAISGILAVVIESFNVFWDSSIGRAIAFIAGEAILAIMLSIKSVFDEVTSSVDYFFTKLEEGDPLAQALAFTLGAIVSALIAWQVAQAGINAVTAIFNSISPFGWIVIAIGAVIAIILVLYKNWDDIVAFFEQTLADIAQWFADRWQGIKDGFDNMVQAIQNWWEETTQKLRDGWESFLQKGREAIQGIKDFFGNMKDALVGYITTIGDFWGSIIGGMFDGIKRIIENIKGIFRGLIDFIAGVFTGDWGRAWRGVVSVFDNIVSGIANIFKWPINAMINGINAFIRGINRIKIPSWVPGVGGAGFNIAQIPRLAKGASLTHQTTATMAEYPNARTNPEIVTPQKIMRETLAEALAQNGSQGMVGNNEITIVTPVVLDGREIAKVVNKVSLNDLIQGNGGGLVWNT